MQKIIIIGDSFAADWSCQTDMLGWPNLLAEKYEVTNLAQAGVSEYKIYKQVLSAITQEHDILLICHTNPYRVHTKKHPLHDTKLYNNCDLIYSDIEYHYYKLKNLFNFRLRSALQFYKHHFDFGYNEDIYRLLRAEIDRLLKDKNVIELNFFEDCKRYNKPNVLDFCELFDKSRGEINHLTIDANHTVFKEIDNLISSN